MIGYGGGDKFKPSSYNTNIIDYKDGDIIVIPRQTSGVDPRKSSKYDIYKLGEKRVCMRYGDEPNCHIFIGGNGVDGDKMIEELDKYYSGKDQKIFY